MALTPGARLGVYDVLAAIGEGGMGQVWRARDTKLNRDVALKVLDFGLAKALDLRAGPRRTSRSRRPLPHRP